MSSWRDQRKFLYMSIIFVPFSLAVLAFLFFSYYEKPNCFDNKKNGDETGVDCGGSCRLLCKSETEEPVIVWSRAFEVSGNTFNAVAYIENPNFSVAYNVPYSFKLFDSENNLITEKTGKISIPERRSFAVFEGGIQTDGKKPVRTFFEFGQIYWEKPLGDAVAVEVTNRVVSRTDTTPRIDAEIYNKEVFPVNNVDVVAIVYDSNNQAIATSRTVVENLPAGTKKNIVFTWPRPFPVIEEVCDTPVDTVLVIDRSGSMAFGGINPPEPLTSVKNAASEFVNQLKKEDRVGLVTFATEASNPADSPLVFDGSLIQEAIKSVEIKTNETQYTNIADALTKALDLILGNLRVGTKNVIVLLTDGMATHPQSASDSDFPNNEAVRVAGEIRSKEIDVYTIGLGDEVSSDVLSRIATTPNHYFTSPDVFTLGSIYRDIARAVCNRGPNIIQIIPRVLPK